ncbi:hypothetical protein KC19_7G003000 [Ceratodon purpureus]|uniref:J domain-containing protein n=2 Tax=Ceratodon purpureus TaxID=3225 RepID=A0A8T0H5H2_CERPU|nr:hypothetical protein KC19_7G003000 [Ceratodon purpureus]
MAWFAVVARHGGWGAACTAFLASFGVRVASIHASPSCNEKWDNKWKSMVYGYMDDDACRKRHRKYVKRQKRAAGKRALLQWRSVEMHADEYREGQERRRQKVESTQKPQTPTASGYSRRFESEWRAFEKKYRGRYEYQSKNQSYTRSENSADTEDPTYGATGDTEDRGHGESESARYSRHFWSNTWRGFGGGADWDYGANPRWETPYQARARNNSNDNNNIGSPADRLVLGLSSAGPLTLEELKLAFRQCALTWHPDRHDGDQKLVAEAKFKRVGEAYRTLRGLL